MAAWRTVPISELYEGLYDGPHATPPPATDGPVFLGIKNVSEDGRLDFSEIRHISERDFAQWTRRVAPKPGDLVFTYEATLNRYAVIPDGFRGCLGRRMALIRTNPAKVDNRFLYYYFFTNEWRSVIANNILSGSTVDRIPLTTFPAFPVKVPPLDAQKRIAATLSAYDDLIDNNLRRIRIIEEMVRLLYRDWFVNFRFNGLSSSVGIDPDGWRPGVFGDLATMARGQSYRSSDLGDSAGVPFVNLKCINRDGGFRRSGVKRFVTGIPNARVVKKGDIVVAITDMTQERRVVARAALVPTLDEPAAVFSMDLVRIDPVVPQSRYYVYSVLRFSSFADEVKHHANGANVLHLAPERIATFAMRIPPEPVQTAFSSVVGPMLSAIDVLERQNAILRRTRDLLLPRLLSGQINLEDIEPAA